MGHPKGSRSRRKEYPGLETWGYSPRGNKTSLERAAKLAALFIWNAATRHRYWRVREAKCPKQQRSRRAGPAQHQATIPARAGVRRVRRRRIDRESTRLNPSHVANP